MPVARSSHIAAHPRKTALVASVCAAVAVLASCSPAASEPDGARGGEAGGYPVTVRSCERTTTYDRAPERAVAVDINMVEMMLALGVADRMAGTAGVARDEVRPDLRTAFESVEHLSGRYIELEPLIGANPDFLFAGWNYGLSEAGNLTPDTLADRGIDVYELTESCAHVIRNKKAPSFEEVFADLANLGAIFGVPERAKQLVDAQRATLDEVDQRVAGREPVPVFVYDSGEDAPFTAPGLAIPNELIRRAGGVNIFADLRKTWGEVSWEQVIAQDPACILIVDYDQPWQRKRDFLRTHPALRELTAVRDDCILALPYAAMTPGIRNADAVDKIAHLLHPDTRITTTR